MSSAATSPFSIVVGLDFCDAGGFAFGQAERVARAVDGSEIHLVHVFERELTAARRIELVDLLRNYANDKAAALGGMNGVTVGIHLRVGDPAREIARLASEVNATMIVIGAEKGPHMKSWIVGSIAERLLPLAPCPVLVAGPKQVIDAHVVTIEAPCANCVRTRVATKRASWWCELHTRPAAQAQLYSFQTTLPFSSHDASVIPTGVDF